MISRASAIEPISPAAMACIIRLPMAVASMGPATTRRRQALAAIWQSCVFCVPPPTMWMVFNPSADEFFERFQRTAIIHRQAFQRTADDGAFRIRNGLIGAPARTANRFRHILRRQKAGSAGLMNDASGFAAAAAWVNSSHEYLSAACGLACRHTRRHCCTSHRPQMFFSNRVVPPTPPSLVKLRAAHFSFDHRPRHFHAHQTPRARTDVAPIGPRAGLACCRHGHDGTGRIVSSRRDQLPRCSNSVAAATCGSNGPSFVPG